MRMGCFQILSWSRLRLQEGWTPSTIHLWKSQPRWPLPKIDTIIPPRHIGKMNVLTISTRNIPLTTIRVVIIAGLCIQTIGVGFYFLMGTGFFLLDALFIRFHFWTLFAWSMYCAMAIILAANIHLIARLINRSPAQFQKHSLDILASIACMSVSAWANLSYILKDDWTLDSHMFYLVPTLFNFFVLCLASIPIFHRRLFEHNTTRSKSR